MISIYQQPQATEGDLKLLLQFNSDVWWEPLCRQLAHLSMAYGMDASKDDECELLETLFIEISKYN